MNTLEVYSVLPDIVKLASGMWGTALPHIEMVPATFLTLLSLAFLGLVFVHFSRLKESILLVSGVMAGGMLCVISGMLQWLSLASMLAESIIFYAEVSMFAGVVVIGSSLLITTHGTFIESC